MTQKVHEAFATFRAWLKLDPGELANARATHNFVTEKLKARGVIVVAFLQGSLARKTMIPPLRDIDKVVILFVDLRALPNGVQRAAEAIAAALREIYPDLAPVIGKHCVTIDFGRTTFKFDVVPAIDLGDDIEIIDTERGTWKRSNTRALIRTVEQRNKDCDGSFIHQVRIGKWYVRKVLDGLLPGLHVESFAFIGIDHPMDDDEAVALLFRIAADRLAPGNEYWDPTHFDELGRKLDPVDRARIRAAFVIASQQATTAVRLREAGDHNAAIAIWHDLLGEGFPKPDAAAALRGLGNHMGVTAAGVVAPSPLTAPPHVRPWRPGPWQ